MGAVPVGVQASAHGAHPGQQGPADSCRPTARAAPPPSCAYRIQPLTPAIEAILAAKRALRTEARGRRDRANGTLPDAGARLARRFLAGIPVADGATVSGFVPIGTEIDVRPLMTALAARGHPLALPVTPARGHPLGFRRWHDGEPLEREAFGTMAPPAGAPEVEPDLLLVPLLAFDRAGRRLGYGGGYYDRTLAHLRAVRTITAVGVAYAAQEVDEVPAEPHDARLDWVATERQVLSFG